MDTPRALLLPRFGCSDRRRGRLSHACAPRYCWFTTTGPPSLANVLCAVHRRSFHIPGAATGIPRFVAKDRRTFSTEFSATDVDGLLAIPSSLRQGIQKEVNARRSRCSRVTGLVRTRSASDGARAQTHPSSLGILRRFNSWLSAYPARLPAIRMNASDKAPRPCE